MSKQIEDEFAYLIAQLGKENESLSAKHNSSLAANSREIAEQDDANPELPEYETNRSEDLLQRWDELSEQMECVDPASLTEEMVTSYATKVKEMIEEAADIHLKSES